MEQPEAKDKCREQTILVFFIKSVLWNIGGREEQTASKQTEEYPASEHVRDIITARIFELFPSLQTAEMLSVHRLKYLSPVCSLVLIAVPTTSPPHDKYCSLLPSEARPCQDIAFSTRRMSVSRPFEPARSGDESVTAGVECSLIAASLMAGEDRRGGDDFCLPLFPPTR